MISMNTDIDSYRELYKNYLSQRAISEKPIKLYEPVNYIMNLGGKHIRATFLLLAYSLYQSNTSEDAMRSAYAIEMFHNFSLVHDDIMDEADTRRGKPSVHAKYDINTGILSGDVMLILVYEELLKIENVELRNKILSLFTQTAKEVCEGQQFDIDFETQKEVSIEDYLLMIKLKTAVLLACALKVGALLGGASDKDADLLYSFGINIGISFQIQDDLLDTYGEQARVGKIIGGDIQQQKKTILYLTARDNMGDQAAKFVTLYNRNDMSLDEKLTQVRTMMNSVKVSEKITVLKQEYLDKALASLNAISSENKIGIEQLEQMSQYIVNRLQ